MSLAFFVLGLPSPVLWGVVTALFLLIPVIGSAGIWGSGSYPGRQRTSVDGANLGGLGRRYWASWQLARTPRDQRRYVGAIMRLRGRLEETSKTIVARAKRIGCR
jgi:hypothetical protein